MKVNNRIALERLLAEIKTSNQNAGSVGRVNHPPHFEVIIQQILEDEQASELDQLAKQAANTTKRKPRPKRWNGKPVEIPAVLRACQDLQQATESNHRVRLAECVITISRHVRIRNFSHLTRFLNLHTDNKGSGHKKKFTHKTLTHAIYCMTAEGMITKHQCRNLVCNPRRTKLYKVAAGL
jgi:hypothetical protein